MQNGKTLMLHCYKVTMLQTADERLYIKRCVFSGTDCYIIEES
jgi:hypothetical protein